MIKKIRAMLAKRRHVKLKKEMMARIKLRERLRAYDEIAHPCNYSSVFYRFNDAGKLILRDFISDGLGEKDKSNADN